MSRNLTTLGRSGILAAVLVSFVCAATPATDDLEYFHSSDIQKSANSEKFGSPCLTGLCPMGVWALCEYNGDLYAGGWFTSADGKPVGRIARWDGSQWRNVGGGMNHYVYDLVVYDGKLIAGGVFDTVGGVAMGHIAAWDGVSWAPLGDGINRKPGVTDLCIYDGDLIISGTFDSAGTVASPNIAKWNGTSWEAFGPGGGISFGSMTVYRGDLIGNNAPGGGFSRWNGSEWSTISHPINGGAYCLGVFDNKLIAGGFFTTAGEDTVNHIIAWDGVSWTALGNGVGPEYAANRNVFVQTLFNYHGDLIVGGNFTIAGTDTANFVARWDGISWRPVGGGFGRYDNNGDVWVTSFVEYGGDLIAGGHFTTAEGVIVNRIAGWDGSAWYPITAAEGIPFAIEIPDRSSVPFGSMVSIPVTKLAGSDPMFGFDFLISYDDIYLDLVGVTPGQLFDIPGECEWEYFSFRADSGLIRVVGLADTIGGGHHPLSAEIPNGMPLFTLDYVTASLDPNEYATADLEFYWQDCGDNSILMDSLGYDLAVSDSVYDPIRVNITDHTAEFPTYAGAPDVCLGGGPTPVVRIIDYYGGMLAIADTTQIITTRGDININGVPNEIADWVMFLNFFLMGPQAFGYHIEASIQASDVNADGIMLSIADLYYLYRVICGDFLPYPGKASSDTLRFVQNVTTRTVSVEYPDTLGAVVCVFNGDITPTFLVDTSRYLCAHYFDGKSTAVIIHPPDDFDDCGLGLQPGPLFTYTGQGLLAWEAETLRRTSAATSHGAETYFPNTFMEITGDRDGSAHLYDPDPAPRALARISNSETLTLYARGFAGHDVYDVDPATVRVNDTIIPLSVTTVPSHPYYPAAHLEIVVDASKFIDSYVFLPDTSHNINYWPFSHPSYMFWEYVFSVQGEFADLTTFTAFGDVTISNTPAAIAVPAGWPTIGEAVNVAINGDTVIVSDGVYAGDGNRDIVIVDKNLNIKSENGPENTIIDCGGSASEPHFAFDISNTLTRPGLLEGFTIQNAHNEFKSALSIARTRDATTIRNCIFRNNHCDNAGGAIHVSYCSPSIISCAFVGNSGLRGAAVYAGARYAHETKIEGCTICGNTTGVFSSKTSIEISNCIISHCTGDEAVGLFDDMSHAHISCTDIYGNSGGDWMGPIADQLGVNGNISADPLFCDPARGDYSLEGFSPCLPYNNNCYVVMGAYGLGCGTICGDISGDGQINVADPVFLINYLFRDSPAPTNPEVSDLNNNGELDAGDAVAVIDFIFREGTPLDCIID